MKTSLWTTGVLLAALCSSAFATPAPLDDAIADLGHRWAAVNYHVPDAQKAAAYGPLIARAHEVAQTYPGRAEPLVWEAIILGSAAKAEGGLDALSKANTARGLLLDAERIDARALNGSVYNSLGSLYAHVPRWPLGFGDKKKARAYLEKALAINPDGIDPNYFYADLLIDEGNYALAAEHLKRALAAPPRPGREDADAGRRQDVTRLLEKLKQEHGDHLAAH